MFAISESALHKVVQGNSEGKIICVTPGSVAPTFTHSITMGLVFLKQDWNLKKKNSWAIKEAIAASRRPKKSPGTATELKSIIKAVSGAATKERRLNKKLVRIDS